MIRARIDRSLIAAMAFAVVMFSLAGASPALAAPSAREQARDKLAEGVRLLSSHDYAKALVQFDAAYALFPSPKIHYNRGLALEGLGRHADAFVAFSRFVDETKDPSPEYLKHAQRELGRIKGVIGFLEISTSPTGAEVRLDGERLGTTPLSPVPTEPGRHEIAVSASDSGQDTVQQVVVSRGERLSVKIDVRGRQTAAPPPGSMPAAAPEKPQNLPIAPAGRPDQPEPAGSDSWKRPTAWATLAAGAAAAGFGIYETITFRSRRSDFDDLSKPDPADPKNRIALCGANEINHGQVPQCDTLYREAHTALTLSIIGYAAAVVLGGTSAYLFSTSEGSRSPGTTAWSCGIGRLSASCRFTF